MKKKVFSFIAMFLFIATVSLSAATQQLNFKKGWNLSGTYLNNVSITSFQGTNLATLWQWGGSNWKVWSPSTAVMALIDQYGLPHVSSIGSGEGFWVNAVADFTATLSGDTPTNGDLSFVNGWNLLSPKSASGLTVNDLKNVAGINTVWQWGGSSWKVWSPSETVMALINQYGLTPVSSISSGEGFWLSAGSAGLINGGGIEAPPAPGFVYNMVGKLNAVPLPDANVYINGELKGQTDSNGSFDFSSYADGSLIMVTKKGYATVYGTVKNGSAVLITQNDYAAKVPFESTEGNQKPAKKGIKSQDGSVAIVVGTYSSNEDITVSVIPFMTPSVIPAFNDITVNSETIAATQLVPIGGAFVNVEDSSGNPVTGEGLDNITVSYVAKQTKILGDLDEVLNGFTDVPSAQFKKLSDDAYTKLQEAINSETVSLYTLKYHNGTWVYVGNAEIRKYEKTKKLDNGTQITYNKYMLVGPKNSTFSTLEPFAFVLKMNALVGEATICVKEAGLKMSDGSIVTTNQSDNSTPFEWIGKGIDNATVIGGDSIMGSPGLTDENGCIQVTYKLPFVSPAFSVSIKKKGYYDTIVSCEATPNGAVCDNGSMYRIPDSASIKGYVTDKVTSEGIEKALVTLVNPEVLSADKIKSGSDNGSAYVKVGYNPTVSYTWVAKQYYDNESVKTKVIFKENCKGDESCAKLTKEEIFAKLVDPFDDNDTSNNPTDNPTGTWELTVTAVHTFTNTSDTLVEEAFGSFNIDLLMAKLNEYMTGNLSEKKEQVIVDSNGNQTTLPVGIQSAAIYGGFSLGYLYEYGAQNDAFHWTTDLIADSSDDFGDCISGITIDDPIADALEVCYQHVTPNTITYAKSLYPVGFNIKFLGDNFAYLLKPDTANNNKTFLKSGFTIRTVFNGIIEVPKTDENFNTTYDNVSIYLVSYADIEEDAIPSVSAVLDIPAINLVGESATAYLRQALTDKEGFYQINMIPPELSGALEVFAKAEGYKFDSNLDIKLVNDLEAGKVSEYNLELEPVNPQEIPPVVTAWDNWTYESCDNVPSVNWQITPEDPTTIQINNEAWLNTLGYCDNGSCDTVSLLPDPDNTTTGYLWFGDNNTGMFTDKDNSTSYPNTSSGKVCGKAISPVYDLSYYGFPVLDFTSWFEVESVDIAKYQYDQLSVGFMIVSDNDSDVKLYKSNGEELTVKPNQFYSLELLNPDSEPNIQSATVPYSSQGIDAEPVWVDYTVPVDMLAGYKVKFVFYFNSKDALFNGFRGWGVDSIKVKDDIDSALAFPPSPPTFVPDTTGGSAMDRAIK